jgi:hypothetical protein
LDALRRQRKSKEPAVSNDAEVGGCADGNARVVVWRVFYRIGIVPCVRNSSIAAIVYDMGDVGRLEEDEEE